MAHAICLSFAETFPSVFHMLHVFCKSGKKHPWRLRSDSLLWQLHLRFGSCPCAWHVGWRGCWMMAPITAMIPMCLVFEANCKNYGFLPHANHNKLELSGEGGSAVHNLNRVSFSTSAQMWHVCHWSQTFHCIPTAECDVVSKCSNSS